MADSLRGKLLIASPSLYDYFRRAVVLVIEHELGVWQRITAIPADPPAFEAFWAET